MHGYEDLAQRRRRYRGERVYVVIWPAYMIAKAGYTSQQRWRSFMGRGAEVYQLTLFSNYRHALDYESELHYYFATRARYAFASNADSRWLLGKLSGACETYQLPSWDVLYEMPKPPQEQIVYYPDFGYLTRPVSA